jgi:hypothetical protein
MNEAEGSKRKVDYATFKQFCDSPTHRYRGMGKGAVERQRVGLCIRVCNTLGLTVDGSTARKIAFFQSGQSTYKVVKNSSGKEVVSKTTAKTDNNKSATFETQTVSLKHLYQKKDPHFRVKDNGEAIERYEEQYRLYQEDVSEAERLTIKEAANNAKKRLLPLGALIVLQEKKGRYLVIDGRLRFQAAQKVGLDELLCVVYQDPEDAYLAGLKNNAQHGVSLTREDRVKSVREIVVRLAHLSNGVIAKKTGLSRRWIDLVVEKYQLRKPGQLVQGSDGKFYPVGSKPEKKVAASNPPTDMRPFDKLRKVVEAKKTTAKQLVKTYVDVVMSILKEAFATDKQREEFRVLLRSVMNEKLKKRA